MERSDMAPTSAAPSKSPASETAPVDSRDSKSDMGRICIRDIRPTPECFGLFLGVAEPVRMNRPLPFPWSTAKRTASHSCGAICHSSMRCGSAPSKSTDGALRPKRPERDPRRDLGGTQHFAPAAWPSRSCRTISRRRSERRRKPEAPAEAQRRPRAANSPPVALRPSPPWRAPSINDRSVRLLYHVSEVIAEVGSFSLRKLDHFC